MPFSDDVTSQNRAAAHWARPVAFLALACLTAITIVNASVVVDGTRYFWLDDDQMVSMRYARSLADGYGLVWNPGERVEGYTSLGWTLVMAAVHVLPISDATLSLAVKIIAFLLACWGLVLADRLLSTFVPRPGRARIAVLVTLALCADVVFWSANGFETPLLTVVFLVGLLRVLDDAHRRSPRASTYILIGLLPVARSDAYYLAASLVLIALVLHEDRFALMKQMWFVCLVPVLQLGFRYAYYGELLPNTYYLKVAGVPGLTVRGAAYVKTFLEVYAVPLIIVAAGILCLGDRRLRAIAIGATLAAVYPLVVGGDMYPHFRFLAPWVPVMIVLSAASAHELSRGDSRLVTVLTLIVFVATMTQAGIHTRESVRAMRSGNGNPRCMLVAGLLVRDFAAPNATIALTAAGTAPYFSRRPALDLVGKTDAHIAHLKVTTPGPIAHSKFDYAYSLERRPDFIMTTFPRDFEPDRTADPREYAFALLRFPRFIEEYRGQPVPLDVLGDQCTVYVRSASPEMKTVASWKMPAVSR